MAIAFGPRAAPVSHADPARSGASIEAAGAPHAAHTGHAFDAYRPVADDASVSASGPRPAIQPDRFRRDAISGWVAPLFRSVLRLSTAGASEMLGHVNRSLVAQATAPGTMRSQNVDCRAAENIPECQRRSSSDAFTGSTAIELERWQGSLDRLDGLIDFRGDYARLPVMRRVQRKWLDGEPGAGARAPYRDWRRTGSYAAFLDAVVAELQASGDYDRLVAQRLSLAQRAPGYEKDIRATLLAFPGKDRAWVETRMREFLSDWKRFAGDTSESAVFGRKMVLGKLLDGELQVADKAG